MRSHCPIIVLFAVAITCHLGLVSGCGSKNSTPSSSGQRLQGDTTERHLELALQNLKRLEEFDDKVSSNIVVNDLNHWIDDEPEGENWKPDELLNLLPQSYRDAVVPTHGRLQEMSFAYDDFYFLRQVIWARQVATWVAAQDRISGFEWLIDRVKAAASEDEREQLEKSADKLLSALRIAHPNLSVSDAVKLAAAVRLFDWTIRSVQLTKLEQFTPVTTNKQTIKRPDGTEQVEFRWSFPAQDGVLGPGYTYMPWEAMLYGQGDAWQRARVFIQLARQLEITAVMLAFDESGPVNWWRPWSPAVYLGDELFLMDSGLGLPLPSSEGPGIATLKELVAAPESVRRFDTPSADGGEANGESAESETGLRYPVDEGDLNGVAVLIDASFPAMSKRMVRLEQKLIGQDRLILSVRPSELAAGLRKCSGVKDVRIWTVPLDALMYSHAVKESAAIDEESRLSRVVRTRMYGEVNDLTRARHLHFQGRLRTDRKARRPGAIDFYQKANRSDELILSLVHNNKKALEAMANRSQGHSRDDAEAPAFSTTDDPSTKRVPEAKWLSIDGLKSALNENDIEASEDRVKQILQSQLFFKSMHARYWMALALYDLGSFPDSADWLRRIQEKYRAGDRWSTGIHYNLARAFEAMGDHQRATKLYQEDTSPQRGGSIVRSRLLKAEPKEKAVDDE